MHMGELLGVISAKVQMQVIKTSGPYESPSLPMTSWVTHTYILYLVLETLLIQTKALVTATHAMTTHFLMV